VANCESSVGRIGVELFANINNNDSLSDVTLVLIDQTRTPIRRFYCHRVVLAHVSSVFKTMFTGNWREGVSNDGRREVEIPDIDEPITKILLNYIYTGSLPTSKTSDQGALKLIIYGADKYYLHGLKHWCESALINCLATQKDRVAHLQLADMYQLGRLKTVCVTLLSNVSFIFLQNEVMGNRLSDALFSEVIAAAEGKRYTIVEINLG